MTGSTPTTLYRREGTADKGACCSISTSLRKLEKKVCDYPWRRRDLVKETWILTPLEGPTKRLERSKIKNILVSSCQHKGDVFGCFGALTFSYGAAEDPLLNSVTLKFGSRMNAEFHRKLKLPIGNCASACSTPKIVASFLPSSSSVYDVMPVMKFVLLLFGEAGDCVLMRPSESNSAPYVAHVEKIEADNRNNMKVRVRWYYRPEEAVGGRRQFHGSKELFLSDHYDIQSAHTIEGKCVVHTFKNYTKLENVGPEDYFCRFEYKPASGAFLPDRVAVYCKCEMPYNPDDLMIQCEECKDWYHPACVEMTIEQAKQLDHFVCSEHTSDEDVKKPHKTTLSNGKAEPKRQKK